MTLADANIALLAADCHDLDAVERALVNRARAIAEFAATASPDLLRETVAAGLQFRERLERARFDCQREIHLMRNLQRSLQSNLDRSAEAAARTICFG